MESLLYIIGVVAILMIVNPKLTIGENILTSIYISILTYIFIENRESYTFFMVLIFGIAIFMRSKFVGGKREKIYKIIGGSLIGVAVLVVIGFLIFASAFV